MTVFGLKYTFVDALMNKLKHRQV